MFILAMGFGSPVELAIIAGAVILMFGGAKIAGLGKSLGEGISGFKKAIHEDPNVQPVVLETVAKRDE
ncbi:MAG: twin-arginine translocase TatA/TatE family subunit [Janthinobacterium lividum]